MKHFEHILVPQQTKELIIERKGNMTYEKYFKKLMEIPNES